MKYLIVLLSLLCISLGTGCASSADSAAHSRKLEYLTYVAPGQVMPVMQFVDTQGQDIKLADSQNNKLVVLFATWCPDSQRAIRALVASEFAKSQTIDIIAIGREEDKANLDKFAAKYNTNFPLIADTDRSIYSQFANAGVPRFILLDGNNRIVKTIIAEGRRPLAQVAWESVPRDNL